MQIGMLESSTLQQNLLLVFSLGCLFVYAGKNDLISLNRHKCAIQVAFIHARTRLLSDSFIVPLQARHFRCELSVQGLGVSDSGVVLRGYLSIYKGGDI